MAGMEPSSATADSAGGTDVTFGFLIATIDVLSGGVISNTIIDNGGNGEEIVSGIAAVENFPQVNTGGLELVEANAALGSATISGGVVEFGVGGIGTAIAFAASGAGRCSWTPRGLS
jgi:hypothetical protein